MADFSERFMHHAIEMAKLGIGQTSPNPLVGAVVVNQGMIVGEGAHLRAGTAHAEVHALHMAGHQTHGATLYVTLEPCNHYGRTPPCTEAILAAGIKKVVIANVDPNPQMAGKSLSRLKEAGLEVAEGVLAEEAALLNEAYFHAMREQRPFVLWKCASTLDGYIAAHSGQSQFVTGTVARSQVQQLRNEVSAIAVGSGTVLADNPSLTLRDNHGNMPAERQPLRVVFDSHFCVPSEARIFQEPGSTVIFTTKDAREMQMNRVQKLEKKNVRILAVSTEDNSTRVNLDEACAMLYKLGYTSLLLEGGSRLVSSFLQAKRIDKVAYFIAPKFLCGGIPALTGKTTQTMSEAIYLENTIIRQYGEDICVMGKPVYPN